MKLFVILYVTLVINFDYQAADYFCKKKRDRLMPNTDLKSRSDCFAVIFLLCKRRGEKNVPDYPKIL